MAGMIIRRAILMVLMSHLAVVLALFSPVGSVRAEIEAAFGSQLITNLAQVSWPTSANAPSRLLLPVDLVGSVVIGGSLGAVVAVDGSPAFCFLPTSQAEALPRGQRIRIQGHCFIEGTNLLLQSRPLIENDGLHSMYERSAGLWLDAGRTPIRVRYFNRVGDRGLALSIAGPGMARQRIPDAMLTHPQTNFIGGAVSWKSGLRFLCYEGAWTQLPDFAALPAVAAGVASNFDITVSGRSDNFGLVFEGCLDVPRGGFYTISCESDDGSLVDLGDASFSIKRVGNSPLPALPRLGAGQLISGRVDSFCATLEGVVTFVAQADAGRWLELSSGRGKADVRLSPNFATDSQWLMGARILATGVCQGVFTPEGYKVAGQLTLYSGENLQVLALPERMWNAEPILSTRQIALILLTNSGSRLVHLGGVVALADSSLKIRDEAGEIFLTAGDVAQPESGSSVEALGIAGLVNGAPTLQCYVLRKISPPLGGANELPLLTTVEAVKQMSRDEAKRSYPVKVRGVITFVWPDAGFFLQDETWSVDVRLATNALNGLPQIGEYWEVEGNTFAEFAPDILARRATRLGAGALPEPEHPNWTQLVDGSMDTQYIEVQGVALSADGTALNLLTRGGRITVRLPETSHQLLAQYQGALVRVRGCLIPGRDVKTQQVKLGEFELRNATAAVDEPAPQDPFALPLKHATDLLLFDSHVSPVQRAKIGGMVLLQRDDVTFLLDRSNGVRVVTEPAAALHPGDKIEAVGFPDLTGASPTFNSALVRRLDHGPLPAAVPLSADHLLDRQYDSTRVAIEGTLVSKSSSGADQILELRSGTYPWLARLPLRAGFLPELPWGSVLKVTGVYAAGQGGDRMRDRDIDSFELLLNAPPDVLVLRSPSWWTVRRAFGVAGALLAILLLASVWIWALHRQVEERTSALKSEIEDHKHTELELEKKTRLLTQEIEERLRIEAEVERGHKQLLVTSRLAGMAEVATSVLHNVGNVMTSVNVLSASIVELVRNSKISIVARLGDLLSRNRHELDRFVTQDERGRKMPDFVGQLGAHLADEQALLLQKVKVLSENIQHINEIVSMQQDYAKVSGVLETLPPEEVVEDALRMHGESLKRHAIKLVREFDRLPAITMDRHKVLQILFNLLENAKYACLQGIGPEKRIVVRLQRTPGGFMRLMVMDNGMGIQPQNLTRIFGQGFSTRKDGHGFGLHSSVLAAQDMGGSLSARSDGPGKGATFVLEIPATPPAKTSSPN